MHLICRRYNNILHFPKPKRITKKYRKWHESIIRLVPWKQIIIKCSEDNLFVFVPKNTNKNIISITLRNQQILRVNNVNYQGIYTDDQLEWDDHINHIVKQLSSGSYGIHRVKIYLSVDNLKSLYYSLIHSHLTYAILLRWSPYQYRLHKLEIL